MTLDEARALDAADPLRSFRERFRLPEGVIYLDGNSLGPLPADDVPTMWTAYFAVDDLRAAADAAALLTERGIGGTDADLELRQRRWGGDRSPRATAAKRMADHWARRAGGSGGRPHDLAKAVALAFPDRLSRRRDASGEQWQSVGGRGFRLDPASPLASTSTTEIDAL